jgi:hypothetical protein
VDRGKHRFFDVGQEARQECNPCSHRTSVAHYHQKSRKFLPEEQMTVLKEA